MSKWKSGAALLTLMWPPVPALGDGYNFMSEVSSSFFDPANWIPLLDGSPKVPGESDTALLSDSAEIISSEPGNLTVSKISFGSSSTPVELTIDTNDNFTLTTEFSTRNANRGGIINLRKGKIISDRVDLQISQLFNDDKENIIRGVLNLWEGSSTGQFSAKGDELEFRGDSSDINFRADSNINFVDYRTGSGFKFTGSAFDINQIGAGETTLPFKDSSFSGDINVLNGALRISGDLSLGGDVNLFSDATLSGNISVENINLSDGTLITGGDLVVWEDINLQPDAMLSGNIGISGSVRVASGDINIFTDLSDSLRFDGDFVLDQGGINVFAGFPVLAGTYELTDGDLNIAAGSDPMTTGVRLDFEDGSLVTIDGAVRVGSLGANAILALQDDTQMVADSASIGEFQNSTADVLVTGLYSTLSLRGSNDPDQSPLQLGRRGQGALQMVNGGRVYVRGNPDIPLRFATDPTGEANIQVRGNVSRFETDSDVELSFDGTGELLLENSGVFEIRRGNGELTLVGNTGSATLNIGNNSPAGRLSAEKVTSSESGTGVINFNHINDVFAFYQSPGVGINISGGISVNQMGPGSTILDGQLDYTGPTAITNGRLIIDGELTRSLVSVESGGTLGGIGQLSAPVQIADGGRVSPGRSAGTLTMGELALSEYSLLDFELGLPDGAPGAKNDRINVINNLNASGSSGDLI
ncbi:MAG TPA: hypothetical protein VFM78_07585, partial [Marinobacter sp.]|nr:hypothetical protein [Marinobacter sp.]